MTILVAGGSGLVGSAIVRELKGLNQDYAAFPMVALAGVIVTFLVILAIRLVFELAVAVVHIAENTKTTLRR